MMHVLGPSLEEGCGAAHAKGAGTVERRGPEGGGNGGELNTARGPGEGGGKGWAGANVKHHS